MNFIYLIVFVSVLFSQKSNKIDSLKFYTVFENNKFTYQNSMGKFLTTDKFDQASEFLEDTARVVFEGKIGFINKLGEFTQDIFTFLQANIKPSILIKVAPIYPNEARNEYIEGLVLVSFIINKEGLPTKIEVTKSIPKLDAAAIEAIKQYRFTPGYVNGKAVLVKWYIPISFKLNK